MLILPFIDSKSWDLNFMARPLGILLDPRLTLKGGGGTLYPGPTVVALLQRHPEATSSNICHDEYLVFYGRMVFTCRLPVLVPWIVVSAPVLSGSRKPRAQHSCNSAMDLDGPLRAVAAAGGGLCVSPEPLQVRL